MSKKQQLRQAKLLDLVEQALTQPPAKRDDWLKQNSEPDSLNAARRLLDLAVSATGDAWAGAGEGAAVASLAGRQIGPYTVASLLGEGGMGQVYLAHRNDGQFEQSVAIKVVRSIGSNSALTQQFDIERQILANLRHANIAALLDGGVTEDGLHYVVMEYVDGVSLTDYLANATPDLDATLRLFVKICRAVQSAHQALIIHRDIKPGNILVGQDSEPKLLDFGIAKVLPSSGQTDAQQTILGALTPTYASPEQIRGEPLTTASDVYALGVVLYEVLTGERPHDISGLSPAQTENLLAERSTQPPSDRRVDGQQRHPELGGDLDAIVLKALAAETSRRYGAAGALADDIERYLRQEPVSAQRDSKWYRLRKLIARNRVGAAALALTVTAVLAALVVSLWQAGVAREQRALAVKQLERTEAVSNFLGEILLSPSANWDSALQTGANATISDVLDAAELRLDEALADQPEVRIELMTRISEARLWMEQPKRARALMEKALDVSDRELPPDSPLRVDVRYHLASTLYENDEKEQAVEFYELAQAESRAQGTEGNLRWLYILHDQAMAHLDLGEYDIALRLQTDVIQGMHALYGDEVLVTWAIAYNNLGFYQLTMGDLDSASSSFERGLIGYETFPEQTEAQGLPILNHLGHIETLNGRPLAAIALHERALGIARRLVAREINHFDYAIAGSRLAIAYCSTGSPGKATAVLDEIEVGIERFRDTREAWFYFYARAWCAQSNGESAQALTHMQTVLRLSKTARYHPSEVGNRQFLLAQILGALGQTDEAAEAADRSVKAYVDWLGADHPFTQRRTELLDAVRAPTEP